MKLILIILIIVLILIGLIIFGAGEYAFYIAFTKHKKTEEEAYEYLKVRKMLDKDIYKEVDIEEVYIKSRDNYKLKGYLIEKYKNTNKYMILVHGFTANHHVHMPFARVFLNEGFNVLLVDERNHGESEGKYPSYGYFEQDDINRWIDFLYERKNTKLFLGLHGQSMGGATVLMCGSKNSKVNFIIDDCGYSSARKVIESELKRNKVCVALFYKLIWIKAKLRIKFNIEKAEPIEDIKQCDKPILFIHGDKDHKVPCYMAEEMYKSRKNKYDRLFIVEGADHMWAYPLRKKEYEKVVHEFINNVEKASIS